MSGGNIKVVVRCRPLNSRELVRGAKGLITMDGNQTTLDPPELDGPTSAKAHGKKQMSFSFDKSYWSAGPREEPGYASQQTLYEDLGVDLLDHSFEGFNTCIFAYGQTGSGKSYSMMGYGADKGIIPLTTSELFRRVEDLSSKDPNLQYTVEVSYIEIYNEKVRDLLNPKNKGNLKVREHPSLGPYVEDLSRLVVENYAQMMTLMDEGNKARTVASTNMNETSSRSHAVFTVILTQKRHDTETNMTGEKVSKISLVDLAGSERQASTGATGTRLREGANINKSLTTLGKVIAALAQASSPDPGKAKKKKEDFVPYRDSVLTWLLKESLGGNSKTAMIAAISPADYEETLSTLRYADAAKRIKTHAVVNEDPNAKLIRDLKEELEMLRSRVANGGGIGEATYDPSIPPEKQIVTYQTKDGEIRRVTKLELQDQLEASEKLMDNLNLTWEQKMAQTQAIHVERERALEEMGITVDKDVVGVSAPQKHPSLVNLNEDPLMSECLIYQIKPGSTTTGSLEHDQAQIKLSGANILPRHCVFVNEEGVVSVEAMPEARMFVNGKRIAAESPVKLLNGFRVILGDFHVFRFNDPAAVRAHRRKVQASGSITDLGSLEGSPSFRPESPGRPDGEMMDWSAARREVADIEKLGDQDLEKLFDDIVKVRTQRKQPGSRAELDSRFEDSPGDNPWATQNATTMTSSSLGTPVMLDGERYDPPHVDAQSEASTEQPLPRWVGMDQKSQDERLESQHLTKQLRSMALELRRSRAQAVAARALEHQVVEPAHWTAREVRLVQWAVDKWKSFRSYVMAEEILTRAVDLKEANIIAHEMDKNVTYNFLVVHGSSASPTSSLDSLNGVMEFEDLANTFTPSIGPCVAIKVVDKAARAVYTWDMKRFDQQLAKMRHVLALKEKPGYSMHFKVDSPFTDNPPPSYSYIGAAKASLSLLANQMSSTMTVPILCPYTMEAIGSCRIDLKPSLPSRSGVMTPESAERSLADPLVVGTKYTFTMTVDTVKAVTSTDFLSVHAQSRLSSMMGSSIESEDTYASMPVDLTKNSSTHLSLRKTLSVIVTPEILEHMTMSWLTVEFFAKVQPSFLSRLERFDKTREVSPPSTSAPATPIRSGESRESRPIMRRCETDFIGPEQHDVLCAVMMSELSSDGSYATAEVVDDVIQLHQGVQRRLTLALTHSSGKALPWTKILHVSTSDIRTVTKGITSSVSRPGVECRMSAQNVEFLADGTSRMEASGQWDSAAHHSLHLDRRTPSAQYLLVRLTVLVEIETVHEPAVFNLDLPIAILPRDARRSNLFAFFSSSRSYSSLTFTFSLDLAPPIAKSASDLWRLDTAKKHVRGQEALGEWKSRSLSLLTDFERLRKVERGLGEVQVTKVVLEKWGEVETKKTENENALLERCIRLWRKAMEQRIIVDVAKRTEEEEALSRKLRKLLPDLEPKLVPTVTLQPRLNDEVKSGSLMILRDSQANTWDKMWFSLKRPYLLVQPSPNEKEVQVIKLSKAYVINSPDVEMLLGRRFAFTVFTPSNSYVLQAPSARDLKDWISVISTSIEP